MSWDVPCPRCSGTGKNTEPGAEELSQEELRLRRRAAQFVRSAPVAQKLADLKEEWEELKALATSKAADAEVIPFQEYIELREGDNVITRAHKTANTHPACPDCKGKGKELTAEGKALLEFIKRWPPE
ncbi:MULTISPECIES: hypothetical protein [Crossiella]|uniref:Excinuclease UvrABC ATPase subunit n=1 Tax=Crossiella cryophila TaxID=43355 RepID=A0A7W7C5C8_9PSEU|nr:hypothetical protein [Crossiella cryophila]MBB4674807.1 excinuclease UvrABC ATPase subunit [Crossiella cryophila]